MIRKTPWHQRLIEYLDYDLPVTVIGYWLRVLQCMSLIGLFIAMMLIAATLCFGVMVVVPLYLLPMVLTMYVAIPYYLIAYLVIAFNVPKYKNLMLTPFTYLMKKTGLLNKKNYNSVSVEITHEK